MFVVRWLLTIAFFAFFMPAFGQDSQPVKTIDLEWEPVENAFGYEVRLTPTGPGQPIAFKTLENKLQKEVPIGTYVLRIRSRHKGHAELWSPWSAPVTVEVLIKELSLLEPAPDAVLVAADHQRQEIEFAWTPIEKAKRYNLQIWTEETKDKPILFSTTKTRHRLKLLPSRIYFWQVTFDTATEVTYIQEAKPISFMLQGPKLVQPAIKPPKSPHVVTQIEWRASKAAQQFSIQVFYRHLDESDWKLTQSTKINERVWNFEKLKPGAYKIEVTAHAAKRAPSDPGRIEFLVKPQAVDLNMTLADVSKLSEP